MTPYKNLQGNSGVVAYAIEEAAIEVMFRGGARYLYTYGSAGREAVERMKVLAEQGHGLSTYISRSRPRHAAKR